MNYNITIGSFNKKKYNEDELTYMRLIKNNKYIIPNTANLLEIIDGEIEYSINEVERFVNTIIKDTDGYNKKELINKYINYYIECRKQLNRDRIKHNNFIKFGKNLCKHKVVKNLCLLCKNKSICKHGRSKIYCVICKGSMICGHFCYRKSCRVCNKDKYCKHDWCDNYKDGKDNICLSCKVHLYPDKFNVEQKTKEQLIASSIIKKFNNVTWILNKQVECGNSKKRPDMMLDLGNQVILIEIDENEHTNYSCENKRLCELFLDCASRPFVCIRFNPDSYKIEDKKIEGCFSFDEKNNIIVNQEEFEKRFEILVEKINYYLENGSSKDIECIKLFYDC